MAKRFSVPSAPAVYTTSYKDFKGVDFRPEEVSVDRNRFADCRNIVFDKSGFPEKRLGWRVLTHVRGKIYGKCIADIDGERETFVQINGWICTSSIYGSLYAIPFEGDTNPLGEEGTRSVYLDSSKSIMFSMNDCIYVINQAGYIVVKKDKDGVLKAYNAIDEAYVPITTVNRRYIKYVERYVNSDDVVEQFNEPGITYENVNFLSKKRVCTFISKDLSTMHDAVSLAKSSYGVFTLDGKCTGIEKVEILDTNGTWVTVDEMLYESNVNSVTVYMRVSSANEYYYALTPMYDDGITDNIRITYQAESDGLDKIINCIIAVKFGINNDDRVFITGNDEYKNYIW